MKAFVDTNVFVASLTDEPGRGDVATEFLNRITTSVRQSSTLWRSDR